jgi:polysaccharide export outer membrane protein
MHRIPRAPFVIVLAGVLLAAHSVAGQNAQDRGERVDYLLAPEDTILVRVPDAEEFALEKTPYRIDNEGYVNLPLLGRWRAAGRTTSQLETELTQQLKSYYLAPRVAVSVAELHTQPVSILGAVTTPGLQRITERETLLEGLSRAGGLRPEAGRTLTITRRLLYGKLPLPEAKDDPTGQYSIAELALAPIMSGDRAAGNIVLEPHDVVTVSRAQLVYVLGEVARTGGFVLNERDEMTTLKALALAGGLSRTAAPGHARILRRDPGTAQRREIPVNLSKMMKNSTSDMELQAEDILYIPGDLTKKIATRTIEAAIGIGSNIAIWRSAN